MSRMTTTQSTKPHKLIEIDLTSVRKRTRPQPRNDNSEAAATNNTPTDVTAAPGSAAGSSIVPVPAAREHDGKTASILDRTEVSHAATTKIKSRSKNSDYEVGYGRPPVHTRFQKGAPSPNPAGRGKGNKNMRTHMTEVWTKPITVRLGGKQTKMPLYRAVLERLAAQALEGNPKAIANMKLDLKLIGLLPTEAPPPPKLDEAKLSDAEIALLAHAQRVRFQEMGFSDEDIDDMLRDEGLIAESKEADGPHEEPV